jgi:hypothetical protein
VSARAYRTRLRAALRTAAPALALGVAGLTVACADAPLAPTGPAAAPGAAAFGKATAGTATTAAGADAAWLDGTTPTRLKPTASGAVTQYKAGDTTVTLLQVGTDAGKGVTVGLGLASRLHFPYAAGSICDPAASSYGPGTWDTPCAAATRPVRIVAKSWLDAHGKVATDFRPALRFVPGLGKPAVLVLKDVALAGTPVDYCSEAGCVDEALADPALRAYLDHDNGFVYRAVKHFSGYTVVANRATTRAE